MTKWEISAFGWHGITGVYCLCSIVNGKNKIHYIGSSKNIGKRVNAPSHPYRKLFNDGLVVYIKFKECSNYLDLEKDLIRKLKPQYNKNYING